MSDDKPPITGRRQPPEESEWPEIWLILAEAKQIAIDLGELSQVARLLRKRWFWASVTGLAAIALNERIAATVAWLASVMGGG